MATPRLTFLYPHLFRTGGRSLVSSTARQTTKPTGSRPRTNHNLTHSRCASQQAAFSTTTRRRERFAARAGKAVDLGPPVEPVQPGQEKDGKTGAGPETLEKAESPSGRKDGADVRKSAEDGKDGKTAVDTSSSAPLSEETQSAMQIPGDKGFHYLKSEGDFAGSKDTVTDDTAKSKSSKDGEQPKDVASKTPLVGENTVLHMDPPLAAPDGAHQVPHLVPPPYVHHFDSYTLTRRLDEGGYTEGQSVESMKIIRALLAENLAVAKESLVSKSDVENETYLFQAACSELRTEMLNARKAKDEKMRMQRTLLQHEVDILNQKLTQELGTLRDELRGMFNDRKMDVRMEQRSMETSIQELNYKITVVLNSDAKSEVEGLRWVLTRRAVMAVVFMAFMVLSSLRYSSYRSHQEALKQKEKEKKEEEEKVLKSRYKDVAVGEDGVPAGEMVLAANGLTQT